MPSPSNRKRTGRFGRVGRRRDEPEQPDAQLSSGPLSGLTSQAPTQLSGAGSPPKPPPAPRPRPASQRLAVQKPGTRRKAVSSSAAGGAETPSGTKDRAETGRVLLSAAPKDSTRQIMIFGGIGGGVLLLLFVVLAVASSSPTPRRRAPEPAFRPTRSPSTPYRAPRPRRAAVNFHRVTGSIMFICANSGVHPDKEVVIRQCPACGGTSPFTWNKDADQYDCKKCKGAVGSSQIECPDCRRKPRVTRLKHGP